MGATAKLVEGHCYAGSDYNKAKKNACSMQVELNICHRERTVEPAPVGQNVALRLCWARAISCPISTGAALQPWQVSAQCCLELPG